MRWTFITVTYNSAEGLREYWTPLRDWILNGAIEWIVVDNNSTDASVDVARDLGAVVLANAENRGFGAANNQGYRRATGSLIGFVNPDVRIDPSTLESLALEVDENHIFSPQLVNNDGTLQPNGRGDSYLCWKVMGRIRPEAYLGRYYFVAKPEERVQVSWMIGAALIGRRTVWDQLGESGPWDERFFVYYEDADLGMRASALGFSSVVLGKYRWIHGWARETAAFRLTPWINELRSMRVFYSRYPHLLLGPRSCEEGVRP